MNAFYFGMDNVFITLLTLVSVVLSIASVVGAIFIYRVYISNSSIGEFMQMVKTQGYLKSLFRFEKLVSPKIIQFFYGLCALGVIASALTMLIAMLYIGITDFEIKTIVTGIISCIVTLVVGEIFVRIGFEVAILLFKMNENLKALKDSQIARGFIKDEEADDRMASEALSDTFNSIRNTVGNAPFGQQSAAYGGQAVPQGGAYGAQPGPQGGAAASFCPNCGTQNTPGAKFCKGCGGPLA